MFFSTLVFDFEISMTCIYCYSTLMLTDLIFLDSLRTKKNFEMMIKSITEVSHFFTCFQIHIYYITHSLQILNFLSSHSLFYYHSCYSIHTLTQLLFFKQTSYFILFNFYFSFYSTSQTITLKSSS